MTLKLYYSPNACSLAPHIALEEAGADFEPVRVSVRDGSNRKPEYLALNPKGRVPALAVGDRILTENSALLAYIAQTHPQARLAPLDDPFRFAQLQAFNAYLASTVHIAFAHVFRPARYADGDGAAAAMKAKAPEALDDAFALIEEQLTDDGWVWGDYSVSDPYLYVMTRWRQNEGMGDRSKTPKVEAHARRLQARPAVQRVLEREGLEPI